MREVLSDWQRDWIEANGKTDELEVVIKDGSLHESAPCIYEGSFAGIPKGLLGRKVVKYAQILTSSVPERVGAYSLTVEGGQDEKSPGKENQVPVEKTEGVHMPTRALLKVHDDVITVPEVIGKMMEEYNSQGYQVERLSSMNFKIALVGGWVHIYWQDGRIWQEIEQETSGSAADAELEDKGADVEHILRERFFYYFEQILSAKKVNLVHWDICMELKKVAGCCGYTKLAKEMHSLVCRDSISVSYVAKRGN